MRDKKVWDKEYSTCYLKEHKYLKEHGVRYTFAYVNDAGTTVWKYAKTKELFSLLAEFYK